jgi:hypothetical protein
MEKFEATLAAEYASLDAQFTSSFASWNQVAYDAIAEADANIAYKLAHMDEVFAGKRAAMNAEVEHLTEDFLLEFWHTIEEIYDEVSYYERSGLIWKALYQKDKFLAAIDEIRNWMFTGLADTRALLVSQTNAERMAHVSFITE